MLTFLTALINLIIAGIYLSIAVIAKKSVKKKKVSKRRKRSKTYK